MEKPDVYVIVGSTASGKTALGIELAKEIGGEIISADSMQIYKDMNIGTAKVTPEEMDGIPYYLIDFVSPDQRYSVSDFKRDAEVKIEYILSRGKTPIIVGGTGLYVNSLIYNINYSETTVDLDYRKELENIASNETGLEKLYNEACKIDSLAMEKISKNDRKRIIRVLEIFKETGKTKTENERLSRQEIKYNYKIYGIDWNRAELYERINKRVDIMMNMGLIDEVKYVLGKYKEFPTAMQGMGYKEFVPYLNGESTLEECIERLKLETRHYAKRQLTWFRAIENITWLKAPGCTVKDIKNIDEKYR